MRGPGLQGNMKPGFKCLSAPIHNLILFASALKPYQEPATHPTDFAVLFHKKSNIGKASNYTSTGIEWKEHQFSGYAPAVHMCTLISWGADPY